MEEQRTPILSRPQNNTLPGGIWSFGKNSKGQLGQGTDISTVEWSCEPAVVQKFIKGEKVIAISGGNSHSCAISEFGKLYTWGDGGFGKLGLGDKFIKRDFNTPQQVGISGVVQISAAMAHNILLTDTAECWTWGCGFLGRLGHCDNKHQSYPISVEALSREDIVFVNSGGSGTAAINSFGDLYTWGFNQEGQLGIGIECESIPKPKRVLFPVKTIVIEISCSDKHTLALTQDFLVYGWGTNECGQLGLGKTFEKTISPELIPFFKSFLSSSVCQIAVGHHHSAAVLSNGDLYTWGLGADGRLGYFVFKQYQVLPFKVPLLEGNIVQVSLGAHHSAAVSKDNKLWVFGSNKNGQIGLPKDFQSTDPSLTREGDGDVMHYFRPICHEKLIGVQAVSCGGYHTLVLISGEYERIIQHTIDGIVSNLQECVSEVGPEKVRSAIDSSNGRTAIHWATYCNKLEMIRYLLQTIKVDVNVKDNSGKTPLHMACEFGYLEAAKLLLQMGNAKAETPDKNGRSALSFAVEKHHTTLYPLLIEHGAKIDCKDNKGLTPLDICTFEEGFQLKVLANKHDVVILYCNTDYSFALKLYSEIERYSIKCWMKNHPSSKKSASSLEAMITEAKGVIFICSPKSVSDKVTLQQLEFSKKLKKSLFPLWLEKIEFTPELESLIYRKQLVDFSNQSQFKENISLLVAGLRNLFRREEELTGEESDDEEDIDNRKRSNIKDYVFLCYDQQDKNIADNLERLFKSKGVLCEHTISGINKQQNSKLILNCKCFLFLLTSRSAGSSKLRDQLALAENHNKPIFSIIEQGSKANLKLDPAMQYTLAKTPPFEINRFGLDQLLYLIKSTENIMKMKKQQQELEKQLAEIEEKILQQKRMFGILTHSSQHANENGDT